MNLAEMRGAYIDDGYGYEAASTRSCQDAFLVVVASSVFADKVTFKGGIVMQQVSGDRRRATQDIDFDFMRYSIADDSIRAFVKKLNSNKAGIRIRIDGPIEELKHQDYNGRRVHVTVLDEAGNSVKTKLDIGVHADLSIEQREICFDVMASDGAISLLGNTDEQMVTEKMRSLLRFGARSTRYKDIFDVYYHLRIKGIDVGLLDSCMAKDVFGNESMREEDWADVHTRLEKVFSDRRYGRQLSRAKDNWLELPAGKVTAGILSEVKKFMMKR